MMMSLFLKSAAVIMAKKAIVGLLISSTFADISWGDNGTDIMS
jgi:hypothetical protein